MKLHYALRTGPPGRPFIRSCTSASDLPVGTLDLDDDLHLSSCNHHQPRPKSTSKPDLYVHSKTSAAIFRIHAPRFRMLLFYSKIQQNRHKIASEKEIIQKKIKKLFTSYINMLNILILAQLFRFFFTLPYGSCLATSSALWR